MRAMSAAMRTEPRARAVLSSRAKASAYLVEEHLRRAETHFPAVLFHGDLSRLCLRHAFVGLAVGDRVADPEPIPLLGQRGVDPEPLPERRRLHELVPRLDDPPNIPRRGPRQR